MIRNDNDASDDDDDLIVVHAAVNYHNVAAEVARLVRRRSRTVRELRAHFDVGCDDDDDDEEFTRQLVMCARGQYDIDAHGCVLRPHFDEGVDRCDRTVLTLHSPCALADAARVVFARDASLHVDKFIRRLAEQFERSSTHGVRIDMLVRMICCGGCAIECDDDGSHSVRLVV